MRLQFVVSWLTFIDQSLSIALEGSEDDILGGGSHGFQQSIKGGGNYRRLTANEGGSSEYYKASPGA